MAFQDLIGHTLSRIENSEDEIIFESAEGKRWVMYHDQDCCENVTVEDIAGDLDDLIGSPILEAEEVTSDENPEGVVKRFQDSFTWTFYKLGTIKGRVTIRWYGESNGYYSESVNFKEITR